ncbi:MULTISPECIES: hypothetical protein [unclassified Rhodococcus (in: high G+C Gram-positive bacteria)]|uniref:hypothetical protein n=1 Tax=unclassified Rhodococcus (in: high G+C Gram-positive bacteria) TaxID=192944 RepID=UPI00163ACA13|nr:MULTISPECIES: hypothetical protein [unclassified Rhodococcus (in: high G+C Gram-positive bacteria)]MBC2640750.1 hypothetical protein [Rhodococcus sp. 3A]MBC2894505.1 hypothetical protein [Rhodococcus sp. 4CII]
MVVSNPLETHVARLHRNLMPRPPVSDLFGTAGRRWLFRQELPEDQYHAIGDSEWADSEGR